MIRELGHFTSFREPVVDCYLNVKDFWQRRHDPNVQYCGLEVDLPPRDRSPADQFALVVEIML